VGQTTYIIGRTTD
jgi:hypothetical protein